MQIYAAYIRYDPHFIISIYSFNFNFWRFPIAHLVEVLGLLSAVQGAQSVVGTSVMAPDFPHLPVPADFAGLGLDIQDQVVAYLAWTCEL